MFSITAMLLGLLTCYKAGYFHITLQTFFSHPKFHLRKATLMLISVSDVPPDLISYLYQLWNQGKSRNPEQIHILGNSKMWRRNMAASAQVNPLLI